MTGKWEKSMKLFLMIFCYAHRLVSTPIVIRIVYSATNRNRDLLPNVAELRKPCRRVGGRILGTRRVKNITREHTESTNLGS